MSQSCSQNGPKHATHRFKVGDIVDIKGHGRASVIEELVDQAGHPHDGRYHVRYHEDDTTYWCRPKLMRLMHPTTKRVLVARHTHAYRDAMVHNIDRPDVCLEIGCHEGLTTNIISNRATFVTGIDTAPEVVALAAARHPHLAFHQMDGLDVAATRALCPAGTTYTRICIDISGKAPLELICRMIVVQRAAYPQAALIVKNEQLYDALSSLQGHPQGGQQQQQQPRHQEGQQQEGQPVQQQEGQPVQQQQQQQQGSDAVSAVTAEDAAAAASADEPRVEAAAAAMAARLAELLGPEVLAECELFRHQFRPPRTRPLRPRAAEGEGTAPYTKQQQQEENQQQQEQEQE